MLRENKMTFTNWDDNFHLYSGTICLQLLSPSPRELLDVAEGREMA